MPEQTPQQAQDTWVNMNAIAHRIRELGEMEAGLPSLDPDSDDCALVSAGIALGLAAATEFYRDHPERLPDPHSDPGFQ